MDVGKGTFLLSTRNFILYMDDRIEALRAALMLANLLRRSVRVWMHPGSAPNYTIQPAHESPLTSISKMLIETHPDE
jgi:hypothetical protein